MTCHIYDHINTAGEAVLNTQTDRSTIQNNYEEGAYEGVAQHGNVHENSVTAQNDDETQAVTASSTTEKVISKDPYYIAPPAIPTQKGAKSIRYDFNDGARVLVPVGKWHVRLEDTESGNILFACDSDGGWVVSSKKYYVPFNIKVWQRGEASPLLDHTLNLKGQSVLVKFPVGTLGGMTGWFPYAEKFFQKHQCKLECALGAEMVELYHKQYPGISLSEPQKLRTQNPYASYRVYSSQGCLGCWDDINIVFDHHDFLWCPRHKGTERQYECTWPITGKQVIGHIDRLMADHRLSKSP